MEQPARPLGASCCSNVGWLVRSVAWCPFEEGSHLLAAAGDTAALLELRDAADGRATLAPAEGMAIPIDGDVDAIAWGRVHGQICLTAIAGGSVSQHLCAAQGHSLSSGVLQLSSPVVNAPVYSACHLAREMLALTGASRQCSLLALGEGAANLSRTIALHSEGVAVRAHHAQPDHLMVAEACGGVHFLDLREPEGPHPTLSRTLPPAAAAAGLRDADWCPGDSHLVCAVAGDAWYGWDLRSTGRAATAHVGGGGGETRGAHALRWAPHGTSFAVAGRSSAVSVHELRTAASSREERGLWSDSSTFLTHGLPTRVPSVSWKQGATAARVLAGCGDTKICVWSL